MGASRSPYGGSWSPPRGRRRRNGPSLARGVAHADDAPGGAHGALAHGDTFRGAAAHDDAGARNGASLAHGDDNALAHDDGASSHGAAGVPVRDVARARDGCTFQARALARDGTSHDVVRDVLAHGASLAYAGALDGARSADGAVALRDYDTRDVALVAGALPSDPPQKLAESSSSWAAGGVALGRKRRG